MNTTRKPYLLHHGAKTGRDITWLIEKENKEFLEAMRTSIRTECPGKNRRRGEQKLVTTEDALPLVADIAGKPWEYFVQQGAAR